MIDTCNLFELVEMLLCVIQLTPSIVLLTACAHTKQLATIILYEVV